MTQTSQTPQTQPWQDHSRFHIRLQYAVIAAAIILTFMQFVYNRGAHGDEAALIANIAARPFAELHKPLDFHQSAPVAFLWCVKPLSLLIPGECGMRLFPLLCFWASLFIFRKIASALLRDGVAVVAALALFAFNSQMIFHATMAKQYSTDVCAALVLTLAVLGAGEESGFRRYVGIAVAGAACAWFSNATAVMMIVCGLWLARGWALAGFPRRGFARLAFVAAVWGASFGVYYLFSVLGDPVLDYMMGYWSKTNPSFMPLTGVGAIAGFVGNRLFLYLRFINGWIITSAIMTVLFAIGVFDWARRRDIASVWYAFGVFPAVLALSALWVYPVFDRFLLFALPFSVLPVAQGAAFVIGHMKRSRLRAAAVLAVPALMLCLATAHFPIRQGEIRETARFVAANIEPEDKVYVYKAYHYEYYKFLGREVFDWENPTTGACNNPAQVRDNIVLKGRVWLLASVASSRWKAHHYGYRPSDQKAELDGFANCFPEGVKLMEYRTTGSIAILFDFGD